MSKPLSLKHISFQGTLWYKKTIAVVCASNETAIEPREKVWAIAPGATLRRAIIDGSPLPIKNGVGLRVVVRQTDPIIGDTQIVSCQILGRLPANHAGDWVRKFMAVAKIDDISFEVAKQLGFFGEKPWEKAAAPTSEPELRH